MEVDSTASTVPFSRTLRTKSCRVTVTVPAPTGPLFGSGARACTRTATAAATATAANVPLVNSTLGLSMRELAPQHRLQQCPGYQTAMCDRWLGARIRISQVESAV